MTTPTRNLAAFLSLGLGAGALVALLLGCGSRSSSVARVGQEEITVTEFETVAERAQGLYAAAPESAKAMLLDDLVQRSLLIQGAKRPLSPSDTAVSTLSAQIEREVLVPALIERLAPRTISVSEAELRELYEWRQTESHVQFIYAASSDMADAAMKELRGGLDFGAAADRFNPTNLFPPQGDIGFVAPGQLVSPLDDHLRTAPLGQAVGPLHPEGEGWFLMRVLERRPHAQAPFEQERIALENLLQQRKRRLALVRARARLTENYQIRVETGAPVMLFTRYNQPPALPGQDPESSLPPEARDPGRVLARYDGGPGRRGVYTLADATFELEGGADAPSGSMLTAYERWIENRALQRVMEIEARARRLDQEPEVARQIKERLERQLLEAIYEAEVVSKATPGPEDLTAAFRDHQASFARLASATIEHITVPDSMTAMAVLTAARASGGIAQAILGTSAGIVQRIETVSFPSQDPLWSAAEAEISQLPLGAFLEPSRVGARWRIARLVSKSQSMPTLEQLGPDDRRALESAAVQTARDRRLKEYCEELKREFPVTIHRDVLGRLRWSSSPPISAG